MQRRCIGMQKAALHLAAACALLPWGLHAQAPAPQGPVPGHGIGGPVGTGAGLAARGPMVDPAAPKKHVLVLAFTEGFHHGSTSDGAATIWQLGNESGLFDTEIRTDTKWVTKGNAGGGEARNLNWFDAIVAVNTTGIWPLNDQQKKDFLSAIHDDGKGFVAVHAALDSNRNGAWPEYTEMLGGEFVSHPWFTFAAPVIIEDPSFPAMRHLAGTRMVFYDEMYVPRAETWSRSKMNVLMRLDETKLPPPGIQEPYATLSGLGAMMSGANNPLAASVSQGIREDKDYALAWAKMYGKGRVFYTSLGHTKASFTNPDVRKMYLEGIKWALGLTEGSTASHPKVNP
ncbi:MAG: ThuA domain-containing protein [Bryobacterales bacterium]|nr:ThuA domain-containing protein [Bryobacterales bacterium]